MSEESHLSDAIKPLLGMIAGAVATNAALVSLLTEKGTLTREELIASIEVELKELDLPDERIQKGINSFLAAIKRSAKPSGGSNG